ncbi:hypothetical protein [Sphingomonas adhaesiva]|uniref:hypothetical protein n=1 Tax=Sphingomonas adhaesiva TaxID=28212 RepID=UPI002FF5C579
MLDDALRAVAAAMATARDPWWVIGSAAVRLHGVETPVADIDVLTSVADGEAIVAAWRRGVVIGAADHRFRSTPFARLDGAALPIEIMAGLHVHRDGAWRPVLPRSRVVHGGFPVPDRAELIAILRLFGRPKDMRRAALLGAARPFNIG